MIEIFSIWALPAYIASCICIALTAHHKRIGTIKTFIACFFLSPVIGWMLAMLSKEH
jgi:hypothetical protein